MPDGRTMSEGPIDDDLLQRLFDGDLPRAEADHVRQAIREDSALATRYRQLERLHAWMAEASERALEDVRFDDLYADIRAKIAADGEAERGPETAPAESGLRRWWRRLLDGPGHVWMPAAGAAVTAAAVLLIFYAPRGERPEPQMEGAEVRVEPQQPTGTEGPAARPAGRSEVLTVDFGSSTGTVFEIDLAEGGSTPIVWINDA